MINILVSDFYKLRKSITLWICVGMSLLAAIVMVVSTQSTQSPDISGIYIMGSVGVNGYNVNVIFIATFISIFLSSEFSFGTMKNVLSRGSDRIKVYLSKLIVCSIASLFMMVVLMGASLIVGTIYWGFDPHGIATFSGIGGMILTQSLLMVAYAALFACISVTMRSVGAIAIDIISILLFPNLLGPMSTVIFRGSVNLNDFWIGQSVLKVSTVTPLSNDVILGIIIALSWLLVSTIVGIALFRKRDVK